MTKEEALDKIALTHRGVKFQDLKCMDRDLLKFIEEAMELYAKSKWEEAATATYEACIWELDNVAHTVARNKIEYIDLPKFKP